MRNGLYNGQTGIYTFNSPHDIYLCSDIHSNQSLLSGSLQSKIPTSHIYHTHTHTHTKANINKSQVVYQMYLMCEKKLEYAEKNHVSNGVNMQTNFKREV